MKYIDEYRNKNLISRYIEKIKLISKKKITLMEVCGGHTMAIYRFGIPSLLPSNIKLISGPGCPVCVTSRRYIDTAVAYSKQNDVVIATFGDLIRVPGTSSSLEREKSRGADIHIVYSVTEAVEIARRNPKKRIIFLGIGFETTAPTSAVGIMTAYKENLYNFYLFSAHKLMPPAMRALIDEEVELDGYIAPGHVSTITGSAIYRFITDDFGIPVVVSGFEPLDIIQSIFMLVEQIEEGRARVEVQYKRAVKPQGNKKAKGFINKVFETRDDWWRGLGVLKNSGLKIKKRYQQYDAEKQIKVEVEETVEPKGCICGPILKGVKCPKDCPLFEKVCNPSNPIGPCMVSSEGACAAYYKYNNI